MAALVHSAPRPTQPRLTDTSADQTYEALTTVLEHVTQLKLQPLTMATSGVSDQVYRTFLEAHHQQESSRQALHDLLAEKMQLRGSGRPSAQHQNEESIKAAIQTLHTDMQALAHAWQACQNPRRCAAEVAQVAKVDAWLAKALSKLHACQLLPELPDLVVQPANAVRRMSVAQQAVQAEQMLMAEHDAAFAVKQLKTELSLHSSEAAEQLKAALEEQYQLRTQLAASSSKAAAAQARYEAEKTAEQGCTTAYAAAANQDAVREAEAARQQLEAAQAAHEAELEYWAREAERLRLQQQEWVAAKRRAEEILSAEHARLDAILAAKHASLQELEEQLEIERELKVIADQEDAEQLERLTRNHAARCIQQYWQEHMDAKNPKKAKKSKKKGGKGAKAGGKTTEGDKKASGAKKADGAAKGKKKK